MAVTSGFFNSINHDRTYYAEQFGSLFDGIITDGVFQDVLDNMIVRAGSGMSVVVSGGSAWFNRTWTLNDSDLILSIDPSNIGHDRVDTIVIKVDKSETGRENTIEVVRGVPGEGPTELVDTDYIFYHPLAYVNVNAGIGEIKDSNIDNLAGTSTLPFVSAASQHYNIDQLLLNWKSVFDQWFDHLQDELDSNQASNLQHQIDDLRDFSIKNIFENYYDLCNRNTKYIVDEYQMITGWTSESDDGIKAEVTIENSETLKTYTIVITDDENKYRKTSILNKQTYELSEEYTKGDI